MKVKTSTFVKIALGCAALLLTVAIISLYVQLGDLEKEKEKLSASLDEYRKSIEKMEYDLSLPKEDYIENTQGKCWDIIKTGNLVLSPPRIE